MRNKILSIVAIAVITLTLLLGFASCNKPTPGATANFDKIHLKGSLYQWDESTSAYVRLEVPYKAGNILGSIGIADQPTEYMVGSVSYTAGSTQVSVTHGMGVTPDYVFLSANGVLGTASSNTTMTAFYPAALGATTFLVQTPVATNTTRTINWIAFYVP
jgi:hypothetical protein